MKHKKQNSETQSVPGHTWHTLNTNLCACINVLELTNYRQPDTAYAHIPNTQSSVTKKVSGHNEIPDHKMNGNRLPCHLQVTLDMPKELDSYSMNCLWEFSHAITSLSPV
jgi:hypothetical protein